MFQICALTSHFVFFSNRDGGSPQILADQLTLFQPGGAGFNGLLRQRSIRRHGVIDVARYNSVTFYQILCPELC